MASTTPRLPVLMYHRIDTVNPSSSVQGHYVHPQAFRRQMALMKSLGWRAIRLVDALDLWDQGKSVGPKSFAITFDDGFLNFHTHALQVLAELNFPSTVFLVSDFIGKVNEWNRVENDVMEPLMGIQHIREAQKFGVEFGSHTLSHKHLETTESALARSEIFESKEVLEQLLGEAVPTFCYPYGGFRKETRDMVEEAGYRAGYSTLKGFNDANTDRYLQKRLNIRRDSSIPVFLYKLWRGARFDR